MKLTNALFRRDLVSLWFLIIVVLPGCRKESVNWEGVYHEPYGRRLNKIHFFNDSVGYAVGGIRYFSDVMLKTADAGRSWDSIAQPLLDKSIYDIDFLDSNRGFASCLDGKMLSTTDGGLSWELTQMGRWFHLYAVDYYNDTLALTVGGEGYGYGIIHRYGPEKYWTQIDTFPFIFKDIQIVSPTKAFACGYGAIMKTEDSGFTWTYTPPKNEYFSALHFLTPELGYVVGRTGTILKTENGGKSWEKLRNGNTLFKEEIHLSDVAFVNPQIGYVVGDKGFFCKTIDGGKQWIKIEKYTPKNITSLCLIKENEGFLTTEDGEILKFKE